MIMITVILVITTTTTTTTTIASSSSSPPAPSPTQNQTRETSTVSPAVVGRQSNLAPISATVDRPSCCTAEAFENDIVDNTKLGSSLQVWEDLKR
eukprot:3136496-Rhodomonas_salina.5